MANGDLTVSLSGHATNHAWPQAFEASNCKQISSSWKKIYGEQISLRSAATGGDLRELQLHDASGTLRSQVGLTRSPVRLLSPRSPAASSHQALVSRSWSSRHRCQCHAAPLWMENSQRPFCLWSDRACSGFCQFLLSTMYNSISCRLRFVRIAGQQYLSLISNCHYCRDHPSVPGMARPEYSHLNWKLVSPE